MAKKKKKKPEYYGLKTDAAFCLVMADNDILLELLQAVLPDKNITEIIYNTAQKEYKSFRKGKDIRLDVFAKDDRNNLYDIEMQVANEYNLDRRTRYYQARIDIDSLEKGRKYTELADSCIVFVCDFDYFEKGRTLYSFHEYEDHDKSIRLNTGTEKIIINAKSDSEKQKYAVKDNLKAFVHVLQQDYSTEYPYAKRLKKRLDRVNREKGEAIMDMLTRTDEKIEIASEQARKEGREEGAEEERRKQEKETDMAIIRMIASAHEKGVSKETAQSLIMDAYRLTDKEADKYLKDIY